MRRKVSLLALLFTLLIGSVASAHDDHSHAGEHNEAHTQKDTPEKVKGFIKHHLKDAHYFELFHGAKMPLPIIVWDEGIKVFSSGDFKKVEVKEVRGADSTITFEKLGATDTVAKDAKDYLYESVNANYSIFHGKILAAKHADLQLKLNKEGKKKLISHSALIDFSITKTVLMTFIICVLLFLAFRGLSTSYRKGPIPSGL